MKVCTMCGEEKQLTEFALEKNNKKDGRRASCKKCTSERIKKYFEENPEKKKAFDKESYEKRKEKVLQQKKEYYLKKKQEILLARKEYYEKNIEKKREYNKEYKQKNIDKLRERSRLYHRKHASSLSRKKKERIENDHLLTFKEKMRMLVKNSFYRLKHNKRVKTVDMLGADWETVREHIVSQFKDGMTWEAFVAGEIHIDHIKPLATATCAEDIVKLNHYTNLQPLWALDNLQKGATFDDVKPNN